jgi:hypothetical protein
LDDQATPEKCDEIVQEIRYRNIRVPSQLDISLGRRVMHVATGVVRGTIAGVEATWKFIISIPASLVKMRRMSLSEWRELLQGSWATIKHEAKHYWVCTSFFFSKLLLSLHCHHLCSGTRLIATVRVVHNALRSNSAYYIATKGMRGRALSVLFIGVCHIGIILDLELQPVYRVYSALLCALLCAL